VGHHSESERASEQAREMLLLFVFLVVVTQAYRHRGVINTKDRVCEIATEREREVERKFMTVCENVRNGCTKHV
jgi:hypothetical protein